MEFGILGPLAAWRDGRELPLGQPRQRAVLALLLVRAGELVPTATLVDQLWGERPTASAFKAVQVYVSRLRKTLGAGVLETQPPGYVLRLEDGGLDARVFERLLEQGRGLLAADDAGEAADVLRRALGLWRGPALGDFTFEAFARNEIARLEELRLVALEQRVEADLALGRHAEAVAELEVLAREHPLRENVRGLLMLALYRSGRQADALGAYQDARTALVDGLGLDPGQSLQRLEGAILRQDPALELASVPPPPEPVAPPARPAPARKTVTVLCLAPGGGADPELRRAALSRLLGPATAVLERHGGTVETPVAERLTAVFGVPVVHEDDALRALRAAAELRELCPECRIGVATGEVVTGPDESPAAGAVGGDAAGLARAAAVGEILLGARTLELARTAVDVEPAGEAFRLVAARAELARPRRAPMVGRSREQRQLEDALASLAGGRAQLFTILGAAGIGKSRLAAEFLDGIEATVVRRRCLPYGEGITYWRVVEVLRQLEARPTDAAAAAAIESLLGKSDAPAAADEIAWAVRKTLEQAAGERPLVVVLDDIHWGEPAFLDLVEHVADFSRDSPLLLLCMARPELFERRPAWAGGKPNATTVLLEPLSPEEADELLGHLAPVDDPFRDRIRGAAGGNPLFLEEMAAIARDSGDGEIVVPPTIRALLAARLDQLEPAERAVLQRGAVEGELFHRGAVEALAPDEGDAAALLLGLVRKEFVRPDRTQLVGDEAFRFRHLLIRDTAYDALPKSERAELHERLAPWFDEHGAEAVQLDELVGYHLEQACHYKAELGLANDGALAAAARARLTAAGRRAWSREDPAAATNLLGRAADLLPGELDLALELDLVDALIYTVGPNEAARRAASIARRCAAAGDRVGELCGRIEEAVHLTNLEPEGATDRLVALVEEAIPVFEAADDDLALWTAYWALGQVTRDRLQMEAMRAAAEHSLAHARRLGRARQELTSLGYLTAAYVMGPRPAGEVLAWIDGLEARGLGHQSWVRYGRAHALSWIGRLDEARSIVAELRDEMADRGATLTLMRRLSVSYEIELLAGDYTSAATFASEMARLNEERREWGSLSTVAGQLAQALYGLDRLDEADAEAGRSAELGASDDVITQMLWRQVKAKVLARRGEHAEAERLAREAVALGEETDMLVTQGHAWADLAEVLAVTGKDDEAAEALEQALDRYERKGNVVSAERVRARLRA